MSDLWTLTLRELAAGVRERRYTAAEVARAHAARIDALKKGTIRAAGLDVFENEPNLNPEFLVLDNVVLAPHIGSSTEATRRAMAMTAAKNAVAALSGATPPNLINPEALRA